MCVCVCVIYFASEFCMLIFSHIYFIYVYHIALITFSWLCHEYKINYSIIV